MNVLVACEYSGIVRNAFRNRGHDAWSCDLLPSEDNSPYHRMADCFDVLHEGACFRPSCCPWDLVIAHPPCTDLCNSGSRWWSMKKASGVQEQSVQFFLLLTEIKCKWAIENPVGIMSTRYRKPDQIIQPWQFGHGETKATCLWLNGLPKLEPSNIVPGREPRIHKMSPSPDRWKERSRTYTGIAQAMAEQWG